jgi:4-phospho-D-threonate 3-dehydrogenase / 4-phospho-D-erythronate 3-dehydrogenase
MHQNSTTYYPILAITMGDPAGIGPEIAAKTFANAEVYDMCRPLLCGNGKVMEKCIAQLGINLKINAITHAEDARFQQGVIDVVEIGGDADAIEQGKVSAVAGDMAFKAVVCAISLAMEGNVDGTVTGPINKESLNLAGHYFSGHTEIYAHYTNTPKFAMLLADDHFRVIHVTTHVSLRHACDLIKKERVLDVIQLMDSGLRQLGVANPRIGVAGLNPHSGDGGLFGNEDTLEIEPAVKAAKAEGLLVDGPIPPDTLFALANGGKFDGCVAMYHDQGHIPFKLLGFQWDREKGTMKSVRGVNITLGLPIIRTSVDHGTAMEIAGKGIASPDALFHAIEYAVKFAKTKKSEKK